jgi:capsular exopolysaccharide synthesis family protein
MAFETQGEAREIHLYEYLRILHKWRKTSLILLAVIVCTVGVVTFVRTPVYRATTRILIERQAPKVLNIQELLPVDASSTEFYQTQYRILQSRSLAERVVKTLSLPDNRIFNPEGKRRDRSGDDKKTVTDLANRVLSGLRIEPIRNSQLVDISYESTDRTLAAQIANTVASEFIEQNIRWNSETSGEANEFLTKQLESQKENLERSEQALQEYKERYGIIQLEPFGGDRKGENIANQTLAALTQRHVEERNRRLEAEARYREVQALLAKGTAIESIPQVMDNYLVQRLKENEARLTTQLAELSQKFGEKHPKIAQLRSELEGNRAKIRQEAQNVLASIRNEVAINKAREGNAREALNAQKAETQRLSERTIQYGVLEREVTKNRELYESLLKRLKETRIARELGATNVRIIDPAEAPGLPAKPKKARNILLSLLVGVFVSGGLAFFLEYLDNTIKTPDDVERYAGTNCIGMVPTIDFGKEVGEDVSNPDVIIHHRPKSTFAEAIRSIRTAVSFSSPDSPPKTILVTSFVPKEGKTFIAVNLALAMAHAGESVLLVDADMRRPQSHRIFRTDNRHGLSSAIAGEEPAIRHAVVHEKLDLITAGPIPPNPAEIVGSHRMAQFMKEMKDRYDKIVVDSPPISSVTDAVVLSRLVDSVLLVIHGGVTTREVVAHGAGLMRDVNAKVIGAVLNNIDVGKESYYYSHYYQPLLRLLQ